MSRLIIALIILNLASCEMRNTSTPKEQSKKPKLVVGIVVDQMRQEYLYKYAEKYGDGGFKRLLREGFNNNNTHYNYIPTFTAPGHASIYTGSTPSVHGIIGNSWYDRKLKRRIGNTEDTLRKTISPANMIASTITDELRLSNQKKSKVVGVSLKDRGAILPAGHVPNGAYWYDQNSGDFISSSYYHDTLPNWVARFNDRKLPDSLLSLTWETMFDIEDYWESGEDDSQFEVIFKGKEKPIFPYELAQLRDLNRDYGLLSYTPFGNTVVTEIALAALDGEDLGRGKFTDFLAISYSSTDIVGHTFGPQSKELHDVYLRLDRELERLLNALDQKIGKGNYLLFLTADHAVAENANHMRGQNVPAGLMSEKKINTELSSYLKKLFGEEKLVEAVANEQVFLNRNLILAKKLKLSEVQEASANFLLEMDGMAAAYPAINFTKHVSNDGLMGLLKNGYNLKRSGDVLMVYEPGWMVANERGTTHGSGYTYDTHVPLLWFGHNIKPGVSHKRQSITAIAPTLSSLLNIKFPSGATGNPIEEVLR